jgi:hypothetical protein
LDNDLKNFPLDLPDIPLHCAMHKIGAARATAALA